MKRGVPVCLALVALSACARSRKDAPVIRLVDEFHDVQIHSAAPPLPERAPVEWRFDGNGRESKWRPAAGVAGLAVRERRLEGRAATRLPIVSLELEETLDDDLLYEVVVRARASEGARLALSFDDSEEPDFARIGESAASFPWALSSPSSRAPS
jgi:hypothetical protein